MGCFLFVFVLWNRSFSLNLVRERQSSGEGARCGLNLKNVPKPVYGIAHIKIAPKDQFKVLSSAFVVTNNYVVDGISEFVIQC